MEDNRTNHPAPKGEAGAPAQGDAAAPSLPEAPQGPPPPPPEPAARGAFGLLFGVALPGALLTAVLWALFRKWFEYNDALPYLVIAAGVPAVLAAGCAVFALLSRKRLPGPFWLGVSGVYCALLVTAAVLVVDDMDLYDGDLLLLGCALAMVPILFSLLRVVLWLTPPGRAHAVGKPLLLLLALPLVYAVAFSAGMYGPGTSILLVVAVVSTYGFVLLLMRTLYLLTRPGSAALPVIRIVVLFALPLLGLLISQVEPFSYAFWDFSSPIYCGLVILNGVLLMLPEPTGGLRLPLHLLRGAMFVFVVYFFVCLSPFYALSLLGVIVYGAGLLVLAPLFLLFYQGRVLLDKFRALRADYGRVAPVVVFLLGTLILPTCMVVAFSGDKANVELALSYVNGSAGENAGQVNIDKLDRSLRYMTNGWDERTPPPLISGFYNRTVSGSRVLSDDAWKRARVLFFADKNAASERIMETVHSQGTPDVAISEISVDTVSEGADYRSTVHFTIENLGDSDLAEYATYFHLPDGVYISGYYLNVFGERKQGLLTVREAAVWIYNRIVSQARDPGILFYEGEEVAFRVFPFAAGETRRTGIEFLHRERAELQISGHTIVLADKAPTVTEPILSEGAVYVSAAVKQTLQPATRRPHYIFVCDRSVRAGGDTEILRIEDLCREHDIPPEDATVMALNYRSAEWPMTGNWKDELKRFPIEGGLNLADGVERALRRHSTAETYPLVIVVATSPEYALLPENGADLAVHCPEQNGFLVDGVITTGTWQYRFDSGALEPASGLPSGENSVLTAEIGGSRVYLFDDDQPQVVADRQIQAASSASAWEGALRLEGAYRRLHTAPAGEGEPERRLAFIQESFRSGIMTPLTSYIVLETADQEQLLLKKQQEILEGGGTRANGEPVRMSEPPLLICLLLGLGAVAVMHRRRAQPARGRL